MKKQYTTPELTTFGTIENLTAGDGYNGWHDLIAWLFRQEPDPFGKPRAGS